MGMLVSLMIIGILIGLGFRFGILSVNRMKGGFKGLIAPDSSSITCHHCGEKMKRGNGHTICPNCYRPL
ncbi:hypothetical protein J0K78_03530 [Halobacillus sp. GSS1]|uniref:hypothetical protein n=1 Tax=Halobacillus sp. GSS1 TaxID=2815919 RepID=UPI001A8C6BA2|nr:hypothetical protein [Halobacillus sp. GSS1]MBN9653326.1 hypothetical protein [Halobacillus sp. GSS1]